MQELNLTIADEDVGRLSTLIQTNPPLRNPRLVQTILEESAKVPTLLLDTPTPAVFLVEFIGSTLLYELLLYVNNMDYRMSITHEVHSLVQEKRQRQGLNLPHQQIDIHLSRG